LDYTGGSANVFGLLAGDFNKDGKTDLAALVNSDNAVSILLGNGDGTFQNGVEYPTANDPIIFASTDLNGDAALDLAVATRFSTPPVMSILLGNGDGTFRARVDYSTPGEGFGLSAGDFNGDGKQDLGVTESLGNAIFTFLGNGDGTLQKPNSFAPGSGGLAAGDFNGDGMFDLITTAKTGSGFGAVVLPQVTSVLSRTVVNFGKVKVGTSSTTVRVSLTNIGTTTLTISRVALSGSQANQFAEGHTCGRSLAPGASCTISIAFQPTTISGGDQAIVEIKDSVVTRPQMISLTGVPVQ
jgi:hypothetical protein